MMRKRQATVRERAGLKSRTRFGFWGWGLLVASAVLGICLLLWIGWSSWLGQKQFEEQVNRERRNRSRLLVNQVMYIEHWQKLETSEVFRSIVRDLSQEFATHEYRWRPIIPKAPGTATNTWESFGPQDEFEREILRRFVTSETKGPGAAENPNPFQYAERCSPDHTEYLYYQAVRAQRDCLGACHQPLEGAGNPWTDSPVRATLGNSVARNEGDLMAVVQVTIPNGPALTALHRNRAIRLSVTIVTVFLLLAFLVVVAALLVLVLVRSRTAIASNPTAPGVRRSEDAEQHTG